MLKKMLVTVVISVVAFPALVAGDAAREAAEKMIDLKDGATLYVFKDGKMAVEDKLGHARATK